MDDQLKQLQAPKRKRDIALDVAILQQKAKKFARVQSFKITSIYVLVAALFVFLFVSETISPIHTTNASGVQIKSIEHKTYEQYVQHIAPSPWYALDKNYLNQEERLIVQSYLRPLANGQPWAFGGIEGQHYIDRIHAFDMYYIHYAKSDVIDVVGLTYLPDIEKYVLLNFETQLYIEMAEEDGLVLSDYFKSFSELNKERAFLIFKLALISSIIYLYYKTMAFLSPHARRNFYEKQFLLQSVIKLIQWTTILTIVHWINIGTFGYLNGLFIAIMFALFFFARKFWDDTARSWWEVPISTIAYMLPLIILG